MRPVVGICVILVHQCGEIAWSFLTVVEAVRATGEPSHQSVTVGYHYVFDSDFAEQKLAVHTQEVHATLDILYSSLQRTLYLFICWHPLRCTFSLVYPVLFDFFLPPVFINSRFTSALEFHSNTTMLEIGHWLNPDVRLALWSILLHPAELVAGNTATADVPEAL